MKLQIQRSQKQQKSDVEMTKLAIKLYETKIAKSYEQSIEVVEKSINEIERITKYGIYIANIRFKTRNALLEKHKQIIILNKTRR